jgi:hypothetical protein
MTEKIATKEAITADLIMAACKAFYGGAVELREVWDMIDAGDITPDQAAIEAKKIIKRIATNHIP